MGIALHQILSQAFLRNFCVMGLNKSSAFE